MQELINQIIANPWASALIVLNLIIIESLLAVDNAAVLASMVMDLPKEQRGKALRYGIIGAYVFRGICLLFASMLIKIWWLKPLGGLYLICLFYDWYKKKQTPTTEDDLIDRDSNWFYKHTLKYIGPFWASVIAIEIMDLTFSIDNVFAAVAFSDNIERSSRLIRFCTSGHSDLFSGLSGKSDSLFDAEPKSRKGYP